MWVDGKIRKETAAILPKEAPTAHRNAEKDEDPYS